MRAQCDLRPLVIHANYLVNLAGGNPEFHAKSISAFRGEVERALALQAEFLVLHPGSFRGGVAKKACSASHWPSNRRRIVSTFKQETCAS